MQSEPKMRLNLEIDRPTYDRMRKLKTESGQTSLTAVIRLSLVLFELVAKEQRSGGKVVLRAKNGSEREIELLF